MGCLSSSTSTWKFFQQNKWNEFSFTTSQQIDKAIQKAWNTTQSQIVTHPITEGPYFRDHPGVYFCRIRLDRSINEGTLENKETGIEQPMKRDEPLQLTQRKRNKYHSNNNHRSKNRKHNATKNYGIVNPWIYKHINIWTCNELQEWIISLHLQHNITKIIVEVISEEQTTGKDFNTIYECSDISNAFNVNQTVSEKIWNALVVIRAQYSDEKLDINIPNNTENKHKKAQIELNIINNDYKSAEIQHKTESETCAIDSWKNTRMKKWNNKDVLNWIKNMDLEAEWMHKLLNVIQANGCCGEDIIGLESVDDIGDAFEIGDIILCKKIYTEIKNFKYEGNDELFMIKLYCNNENIKLNEEVSKTDTIYKIKTLFKMQRNINFDVKYIHLKYKTKELIDNKTLQQYGIIDENHLIDVVLDDVFAINIYAQGNTLVLNDKVTKNFTIQEIKKMYKQQSSVYANIEQFQFYKQKKLLEYDQTLEQCGIVDEKHLIMVQFEADGGNDTL